MITEEHAKPPPIAVPSQVNHFSKFIYFQHVTQEEQGRAQPPLRRPDAIAGRYSHDQGDRPDRHPARHFRARPHHRRQERACEFEGVEADLAIACIYHLLTLRFALWRTRERVVHRMSGGSSLSNERGSMMNQLAERVWVAALSMSPGHLVDKFLDWLEELRGAMALAETDGLARNEARTKVLFD